MRYSLAWQQNIAVKIFFYLFCFHAMASRFLSSSEDEVRQLLERKDSKNTKRTYNVAQQVFQEYLLGKRIAEPTEKGEIAIGFLKVFTSKHEKRMAQLIRWGALGR